MHIKLISFLAMVLLLACQQPNPSISNEADPENSSSIPSEVFAKLSAQEKAWNDGDIDGFMSEAYWANDSLIFLGSKGLALGYEATRSNYHRSYPDAKSMGTLTFDILNWKPLGSRHGLMIGAWSLARDSEMSQLSGHFTLIWELQSSGWVIIADHSS